MAHIPKKELTKEIVEEWLQAASLRKVTILTGDHNAIIVHLCRALLNEWKKNK